MALDSKNNIKSVFIVPSVGAVTTPGTTVTPGSLGAGSVVITNMSNQILAAGAGSPTSVGDYDKIKIVKDRGANNPLQQLVLTLPSITAFTGVPGVAASEQESFIGFDGTSGTMDPTGNSFYLVKLEHTPNSFIYGKRPANYKYGTYQASASSSALINSIGLIKSLITNFRSNRTTDWRVKSELVADGAGVVITTLDPQITSITFTKYSKTAVVTTSGAVSAIAANAFIRVGAGPTAYTNPVVKVVSSGFASGAGTFNIVLDYVWQGDTTVVAAADLYTVATPGSVGIKITGLKQKYDVNRWRQYDKVRFNVFLEGFQVGTPVTTIAALDGTGVYEQVANDEYISWGDEGQVFVDQIPPLFREQDAVVGALYAPLTIGWLDRLPSLIGAGENKGQAIMYLQNRASGQGADFLTVINSWLLAKFPNGSGI